MEMRNGLMQYLGLYLQLFKLKNLESLRKMSMIS